MAKNYILENVDPHEIEIGIDHELQSVKDPEQAKQIALTNLSFYPDYYSSAYYSNPSVVQEIEQQKQAQEIQQQQQALQMAFQRQQEIQQGLQQQQVHQNALQQGVQQQQLQQNVLQQQLMATQQAQQIQRQQIDQMAAQVPQQQAVEDFRYFANSLIESDPVKKKLTFQGIPIDIEWPKGTTRSYPGSPWENYMLADYGYIRNTNSPDGEEVDVYVNDPPFKDSKVYQIVQLKTGKDEGDFDEYKFMLGFNDEDSAIECYKKTMQSSMFGGCTPMSFESFKNDYLPFFQNKQENLMKNNNEIIEFRCFIQDNFLYELRDEASNLFRHRGDLTDPISQYSDEVKDVARFGGAVVRKVGSGVSAIKSKIIKPKSTSISQPSYGFNQNGFDDYS